MLKFYLRVGIYFVCFFISMYGLSALDFNRFVKQGKTTQSEVLYLVLSMVLAYLLGQFVMSVIYYFN